MMYNNLSELKSDLRMIGSILETEKTVHLVGTAAIALITNIKDMCIGDIDTVTDLNGEDTLEVFISDQAMELVPLFLHNDLNILTTENTFRFGNLIINTPSLDVLIKAKQLRGEYKDHEFLETYYLV